MKVGDLVKTPRYNRLYLIVGKWQQHFGMEGTFVIHSLDGKIRQSLSEHLLELVSEGR